MGKQTEQSILRKQKSTQVDESGKTNRTNIDFWKHRKKIKKVEIFEKIINFIYFQTIKMTAKRWHIEICESYKTE